MRRVGIESPPKVLAEIEPVRVREDRPFGGGPVQKGTSAMLERHLCLVRAGLAAGLASSIIFFVGATARAQAPGAKDPEPSSAPAGLATETVDLLGGRNAGDLDVVARGHGQDRVKLSIHNRSKHRLNVIIPPGLVASSAVGQPGGAGGGRLQSIGLGSVSNREGAFGEFHSTSSAGGLQSIGTSNEAIANQVAVPVGETVDLTIPGVCLNYGLPAPTPRNTFRLVDVSEYTTNARIRRALRSLATYGTSHGVAQAVMWNVCNELPFEQMAEQTGKVMNFHEIALAARFVDALDAAGSSELVDPASLSHARIFVQVRGQGELSTDAKRLAAGLEGLHVLGLPIQVDESQEMPTVAAPALFLSVVLTDAKVGETRGVIVASSCTQGQAWVPLGQSVLPRQFFGFRSGRFHVEQGCGPYGRLELRDGQARSAHPGQHDAQGRKPAPLHDFQPGRQSRCFIRIAVGAVFGRRSWSGPLGAAANPGRHRLACRARRAEWTLRKRTEDGGRRAENRMRRASILRDRGPRCFHLVPE